MQKRLVLFWRRQTLSLLQDTTLVVRAAVYAHVAYYLCNNRGYFVLSTEYENKFTLKNSTFTDFSLNLKKSFIIILSYFVTLNENRT